MQWNGFEISANVSLLFAERPYQERFQAAADAGFTAVETWWPFAEPNPGPAKLDELLGLVEDAGLRLTGLNFYAGDMPGGERGVACLPARRAELEENLEAVLHVAQATSCRGFNLLYGQPGDDVGFHETLDAALPAYRQAAAAVADVDGVVLVEPLAQGLNGSYPMTSHVQALELVSAVGENAALLFDTFHLGRNGIELTQAVQDAQGYIGHVQLADIPDRAEPESGELDWSAFAQALHSAGYTGTMAAEYKPSSSRTENTLWWATR